MNHSNPHGLTLYGNILRFIFKCIEIAIYGYLWVIELKLPFMQIFMHDTSCSLCFTCHLWVEHFGGNLQDPATDGLSTETYRISREICLNMSIPRISRVEHHGYLRFEVFQTPPDFFSGKLLVFHGYLVGKLLIFRNTLSFLVKEAWFAKKGILCSSWVLVKTWISWY